MGVQVYPRYGEPWVECAICGMDLPRSQAVKHYKKGFLVCKWDDDQLTHADYMEQLERGVDRDDPSEQRVKDQGPQADSGGDVTGAGAGGAGSGLPGV